jgi:uncharacterized flavoprotein (TIGR03862 family)
MGFFLSVGLAELSRYRKDSINMGAEKSDVLVVGGGPAGLRAAEIISAAGGRAILADHKASVGRKFLVAGRGGLNLTHSEPVENFPARYDDVTGRWAKLLADFSPDDLCAWAKDLGIETFVGTSGRVFPATKQAAPLLRRWIARLRQQGVSFRARHGLAGFPRAASGGWAVTLTTPTGAKEIEARAVIFALGGASWPQTGSDGGWVKLFTAAGIRVRPLQPANCGYEVNWPAAFLAEAEGLPLKNIVVRAGSESVAGELLITKYGMEGGAIYQLGRALRGMKRPEMLIDLKPTSSAEELVAKKTARTWRLGPVATALLKLHEPCASIEMVAALAKAYPVTLKGPRPIDEAISTAGGVSWDELDDRLMILAHPGLFCAGEMIDWDAPTGGYLLQGCFSTATRAARGALALLETCASE